MKKTYMRGSVAVLLAPGRASDGLEARAGFILEAKDVLTLDQKRLLSYLIGV